MKNILCAFPLNKKNTAIPEALYNLILDYCFIRNSYDIQKSLKITGLSPSFVLSK